MIIDKPEWFKIHGESDVMFECATYGAHVTVEPQRNEVVVSIQNQQFSNAGLKELGVHLYHLGLYLEQNGK